MNTVVEYIKQTLFDHNCVIIANFGGFLTEYKNAEIDPISNSLCPPKSELTFNSSLRKDDGLLKSELSYGEGIELEEAEKLIKNLVDNINDELEKSSKYKIKGLGEFSLEEGLIVFKPMDVENLNAQTFGLPNFTLNPIERNTEEMKRVRPVPPARRVVKRKPVAKAETTAKEVKEKVEETANSVSEGITSTASEAKTALKSEPTKSKAVKAKAKKVEEEEQHGNKKALFILLPVLLMLIAGGIAGYVLLNKSSKNGQETEMASSSESKTTGTAGLLSGVSSKSENNSTTSDTEGTTGTGNEGENTSLQSTDDVNEDSNLETESTTANIEDNEGSINAEETPTDVDNNTEEANVNTTEDYSNNNEIGSGYNVIIGSYVFEAGAQKIKAENPGSGIVKYGKYNCVSVGTFTTESEAEALKAKTLAKGVDAWVVNIK